MHLWISNGQNIGIHTSMSITAYDMTSYENIQWREAWWIIAPTISIENLTDHGERTNVHVIMNYKQ